MGGPRGVTFRRHDTFKMFVLHVALSFTRKQRKKRQALLHLSSLSKTLRDAPPPLPKANRERNSVMICLLLLWSFFIWKVFGTILEHLG